MCIRLHSVCVVHSPMFVWNAFFYGLVLHVECVTVWNKLCLSGWVTKFYVLFLACLDLISGAFVISF